MDENCDIWADVDFGHGTVEVRCTKTGVHDGHKCEVVLCAQETTLDVEHTSANVFDHKKSLETGSIVRQKRRY